MKDKGLEKLTRIEKFCNRALELPPAQFREQLFWWLEAAGMPEAYSLVHYFDFVLRIPFLKARKLTPALAAAFTDFLTKRNSSGLIIAGSFVQALNIFTKVEEHARENNIEPVEDILATFKFDECISALDAENVNLLRLFSHGFALTAISAVPLPDAQANEPELEFTKPGEIFETELAEDNFAFAGRMFDFIYKLLFAGALLTALARGREIEDLLRIFWQGAMLIGRFENAFVLFLPRANPFFLTEKEQTQELSFKRKCWQETLSLRYRSDFEL